MACDVNPKLVWWNCDAEMVPEKWRKDIRDGQALVPRLIWSLATCQHSGVDASGIQNHINVQTDMVFRYHLKRNIIGKALAIQIQKLIISINILISSARSYRKKTFRIRESQRQYYYFSDGTREPLANVQECPVTTSTLSQVSFWNA